MGHAGLRGMAARDSIAAGEVLVSLPIATALVVSPRERCSLPREFCNAAFYSNQPWCAALPRPCTACPCYLPMRVFTIGNFKRPGYSCHRFVQMALKLQHERRLGAASRLAPYVSALPQGFSTPLTWTDAQLAALQYPHLQQQVLLFHTHVFLSSPLQNAACLLSLQGGAQHACRMAGINVLT